MATAEQTCPTSSGQPLRALLGAPPDMSEQTAQALFGGIDFVPPSVARPRSDGAEDPYSCNAAGERAGSGKGVSSYRTAPIPPTSRFGTTTRWREWLCATARY